MLSKLPVRDAEVVILRVGHLRDCEYELQQHRRLARSRGIGPELQTKIFEGPDAEGLTDRQRALITATDEFVVTRGVSPETWSTLASHLNKSQLIEFCMLAAQYDGLAATITTLNVPLDFPRPGRDSVTPRTTSDSSTGDIGSAHRNAAQTSFFCL